MFDARAVLGIVLYFKEKVLKPLRKDGYLNRCNLPNQKPLLIRVVSIEVSSFYRYFIAKI